MRRSRGAMRPMSLPCTQLSAAAHARGRDRRHDMRRRSASHMTSVTVRPDASRRDADLHDRSVACHAASGGDMSISMGRSSVGAATSRPLGSTIVHIALAVRQFAVALRAGAGNHWLHRRRSNDRRPSPSCHDDGHPSHDARPASIAGCRATVARGPRRAVQWSHAGSGTCPRRDGRRSG